MFWDKVASIYDFFETVYNGAVYQNTGKIVAREINADDRVLECACGTGAISIHIAPKCRKLICTDFSEPMLRQTRKKLKKFNNVKFASADMNKLMFKDNTFDKVIAGNVIHLLDDPQSALSELLRVCRHGGKVIIPTYINIADGKKHHIVGLLEKLGANFKRQFDIDSYKKFFENAGCKDVKYCVICGRMPCALAFISKE